MKTNATSQAIDADASQPPQFRDTPPTDAATTAVHAATRAWRDHHAATRAWRDHHDTTHALPTWAPARLRSLGTRLERAGWTTEQIAAHAAHLPQCAAIYREAFNASHRYSLTPKLLENATFNALDVAAEVEDLNPDRFRDALVRAALQGNAQVGRAYAHLTRLAMKAGESA